MKTNNELLDTWLPLTQILSNINDELEQALQQHYDLSLKEFFVLKFISQSEKKELRIQQLQEMVGLSQSAVSRLVVRMEAEKCGALQKHICKDDRRGIYTGITEIGEKKLQRALETVNEVLETSLQKNGVKLELQTLIQML
ncbi:MarR family winged helix-turn-helix transcriptional regulator [Paenibacillus puldeungensis]|uniref:MarR family winged helix-turn-helix transcriptional regulator n=1 Tax=Paenibacillus puldeungensis TaxID=696536 RepID=A0ABW3RTW8_9BACL